MKSDNYKNQINDYLDGKLNKEEEIEFSNYLKSSLTFKALVDDIKFNNNLLKSIPTIQTKRDFIINLNKKIDLYDNRFSIQFLKKSFNLNSFRINLNQFAGIMSFTLIISFSIFKISSQSSINNANLSNTDSQFDTTIAVNDADSLENINSGSPILLIGNDK
jgi:hypothetical protein